MKPLPPDRASLLRDYESLLRERAVPLGFVSPSDRDVLWERHVLDSLRAEAAVREDDRALFDLGSGAGLPGIPLAVLLPRLRVLLIESQRRRVAFLELALERLGLENARVLHARAEQVADRVREGDLHAADVVTARAFAPIEAAWRAAAPLLRPGGRLVYFAGGKLDDPESRAREAGGGEVDVAVLEVVASSGPLVIMART